jgi:hypothetical protein
MSQTGGKGLNMRGPDGRSPEPVGSQSAGAAVVTGPVRLFFLGSLSLLIAVIVLLPYGGLPLLGTLNRLPPLAAGPDATTGLPAEWLQSVGWRDCLRAGLIYAFPLAGMVTIASALVLLAAVSVGRIAQWWVVGCYVVFLAWTARAWQGHYGVGLVLLLATFGIQAGLFFLIFPSSNPAARATLGRFMGVARIVLSVWWLAALMGLAAGGRTLLMDYIITMRDVAVESSFSLLRRVPESYYHYSPWVCWATTSRFGSPGDPPFLAAQNAPFQQVAVASYLIVALFALPLVLSVCILALWRGWRAPGQDRWKSCLGPGAGLALGLCAIGGCLCWPWLKAAVWLAHVSLHSSASSPALADRGGFLGSYALCRRLAGPGGTKPTARETAMLARAIVDASHPALRYWAMKATLRWQPDGWRLQVQRALQDPWPVIPANALRLLPPRIDEVQTYVDQVFANPRSNLYLRAAACDYRQRSRLPPSVPLEPGK